MSLARSGQIAGRGGGRESVHEARGRAGNPEFGTVTRMIRAPGLTLRALVDRRPKTAAGGGVLARLAET